LDAHLRASAARLYDQYSVSRRTAATRSKIGGFERVVVGGLRA
jgi:hypothetical protein